MVDNFSNFFQKGKDHTQVSYRFFYLVRIIKKTKEKAGERKGEPLVQSQDKRREVSKIVIGGHVVDSSENEVYTSTMR